MIIDAQAHVFPEIPYLDKYSTYKQKVDMIRRAEFPDGDQQKRILSVNAMGFLGSGSTHDPTKHYRQPFAQVHPADSQPMNIPGKNPPQL